MSTNNSMKPWPLWLLAFVALTGITLPFLVDPPTREGQVTLYAISASLLAATLGLSNPSRFSWALKVVGAVFIVAYGSLFASETVAWWRGKPFFGDGKSGTSMFSSMKLFAGILIPAVYFILKGGGGGILDFMLASRKSERSEGEVQ